LSKKIKYQPLKIRVTIIARKALNTWNITRMGFLHMIVVNIESLLLNLAKIDGTIEIIDMLEDEVFL
jgi:hypothetical protein